MSLIKPFARSVFLVLLPVTLAACGVGKVGFNPVELAQLEPSPIPSVSPGVSPLPSPKPSCSASTTTKRLRILVMVDNSGSTLDTDPNQDYRVETLERFLSNYGTHDNLSYGFGYFDDHGHFFDFATSGFRTGSVARPIGTARDLRTALAAYQRISPDGNTYYRESFKSLQSAIVRDQGLGNQQDYAVVFMSDGQPTDLSGNTQAQIRSLVKSLQSQASAGRSQLTVSSVYFGPRVDTTSIDNLKVMASEGRGQFVDTNQLGSGGLVIDDVIAVPGCP